MRGTRNGVEGRRGVRAGFTIIEVIVIVVILGILAAVIAPRLLQRIGQSKQSVAQSGAATLASSVQQYMIDCGKPESGATLDILIERPSGVGESSWKGPYLNNRDDLVDPWGHKYVLVIPGVHNVDFDVVSYGEDGQPGGEGDAADITNGKKR